MANFFANSMVWTFPFAGWGIVTGIGLLRVWRWARISTLIFSGLLAAFGIAETVASLLMPGDLDTLAGNASCSKLFLYSWILFRLQLASPGWFSSLGKT